MKQTVKALALFTVLMALAGLSYGQTAMTQTTISAAVNGNGLFSGASVTLDTSVTLASVTGVTAANNGAVATYLYIDREAMAVIGVNSTTKVVTVLRGQLGTFAAGHVSGTMVLVGVPGYFLSGDPQGACTAASTALTPYINVNTGMQWLCSSVTTSWVPGFGNPGSSQQPPAVTAAVASAAGQVTPSGPLFHITGTLAITGFLVPVGFNGTALGGGQFCVIPDGAFTWTTANNIALAGTAVVNKQLCFLWDGTNSKWVPSYIA